MKVIYNRFIPFKGFTAIALFGVIFARKEFNPLSVKTIRHEQIHAAQADDCGGWLQFYLKYLIYHLRYGYMNNPFEIEAYSNDFKKDYLITRQRYSWEKYLN
jgi:hypothetical protein